MNDEMSKSAYIKFLVVIFLAAFGLRLAVAQKFVGLNAPPKAEAASDQVDYELFAANMATDRGFTLDRDEPTAKRPPGTAFFLLPVYQIAGRSWTLGRIEFALISALSCLVTAWVGSLWLNRRVGVLAAALLAIYPGHFYYAMHFLSETPGVFLLAIALGASLESLKTSSWKWPALAGLVWGLLIITRPNVALAAGLFLLVLIRVVQTRQNSWMIGLRSGLICTLLMIIPVGCWMARNAIVLGHPTISTIGGPTLWGANNEKVLSQPKLAGTWIGMGDLKDADHPLPDNESELEKTNRMWQYGVDFVKNHPKDMPYLTAMKLYRFFTPFETTNNKAVYWAFALGWIGVGLFAFYGLIGSMGRRNAEDYLLLFPLIASLATTIIFYGSARFRDAIAPVWMVWAAAGLLMLVSSFSRRSRKGV